MTRIRLPRCGAPVVALLVCALAAPITDSVVAQSGSSGSGAGAAAGPQDGTGRGQGGRGSRRAQDPEAFVERVMASDANGDGMISRDELPERLADRIFEAADADADGLLTRDELMVFIEERAGGRGGRGGAGQAGAGGPGGAGGAGGAGHAGSFHDAMEQAGRAMRGLSRSSFTAESRSRDLQRVTALESALLTARTTAGTVSMSANATAAYGTDRAAFETALRMRLIQAAMEALTLDKAITGGDAEAARTAIMRLAETRDSAHDLFESHDHDQEHTDEAAAPRGGAGGEGGAGRGGRGGRGGSGGGAGGSGGGGSGGRGGA